MAKMTKAQIRERQEAIMNQLDEMEQKSREANGGEIKFTEDEATKYDALVRESAGLSARAKELASDAEMAQIRSNEEKGAKLREMLQNCKNKRENATTILANAAAGNVTGNLDAGKLIPVTIEEIIDTKVPGIELPADLKMVTGVTGTEIIPYSTNDVKFTVNGEVQKVSEQGLDFANVQASPQRVAASVAVSHRAIDNAAFDILGFITFKLQKGLAMFTALHVYSHCNFDVLKSPFASVAPETLTLDENIGKNLAKKIAEMYDLGFEGIPYLTMDKVTEVDLAYTKAIPGTAGDRTVVEDGKCCGYPYTVSPFIDYTLNSANVPVKDSDRYIGIGHYGYLALQQHGEFRFNVDAVSSANFDRGTVVLGISTDLSITELSSKVNGKNQIQAFKLIKLVEPEESTTA